MKYDFSKTLFRCHALGQLMSNAKKEGELSAGAKKYLNKFYWEEKYGKKRELRNKYVTKGKIGERPALDVLSITMDCHFEKNEVRLSNNYITGIPDAFKGESIFNAEETVDTKCSWDAESFGKNIIGDLDEDYQWQNHGYMALTKAKKSATAYCLVDTPDSLINLERDRLFYSKSHEHGWVTQENAEYLEMAAGLELSMIFSDIEMDERILLFPIERDENKIIKIYSKVGQCRDYLDWFQNKHLAFNKTYHALS